jgi:hypothetical protein
MIKSDFSLVRRGEKISEVEIRRKRAKERRD